MPAIWSEADKQKMVEAAFRANMISNKNPSKEELLVVLEPEAASCFVQEYVKSLPRNIVDVKPKKTNRYC